MTEEKRRKPAGPRPGPGAEEQEIGVLVERLSARLVELRLETPAVFFLELSKPVSFMASQAMIFLGPLVQALFPGMDLKRFARLFEDRRNVERLIRAVEEKSRRRGTPPPVSEDRNGGAEEAEGPGGKGKAD